MKKRILGGLTGGLVVIGCVLSNGTAHATLDMQKKAKAAGITSVQNCQSCHNEKLPKKGAVSHNDRGKWLLAEKDKRKAKEVDPAWLKAYTEKK